LTNQLTLKILQLLIGRLTDCVKLDDSVTDSLCCWLTYSLTDKFIYCLYFCRLLRGSIRTLSSLLIRRWWTSGRPATRIRLRIWRHRRLRRRRHRLGSYHRLCWLPYTPTK